MTMRHPILTIESFAELEEYLANWRSFKDKSVYDPSGMMALLCACINNLRENTVNGEIEELALSLTEDERSLLRRLIPVE